MNRFRAIVRRSALVLSSFLILMMAGCGASLIGGHSRPVGATQTITFTAVGTQTVGATVTLSATASSGLPVSFISNMPSVCTVSGSTATMITSGSCTIEATQAGNSQYQAASAVQNFAVNGKPQTINFAAIASQTLSETPTLTLPTPTASSGLAVALASVTGGTCSVNGTVVTLLATGTCSIQATQPGNSTWAAAPPVTQSFTINGGGQSQTITFVNPGPQTVGTPLMLAATASSGLPVSFASQTTSVCTVSGTTATFLITGTCTIQATQAGNATYAAATPVSQSFAVSTAGSLLPQAITFNNPGAQIVGTPLTLVATASSGLPVTFTSLSTDICTVSGTTATFEAVGTCTIQATQPGNAIYAAATPVSQGFPVNAATCSLGSSYNFPTGPTYSTKSGTATLSRAIPWAPGIVGGVPQRTTICATLSATGNGDDAAINAALASCPDNEVVLLNPGAYNIKNAIIWSKSNVVLRGSGGPGVAASQQTRLMADPSLYGPVVSIGLNLFPHPTGASVSLTADALQGTNTATVSSTSGFKAGDLVTVDMLVDPADDTGTWIVNAPTGETGLVYPYSEYNPTKSPQGDASRGWFSRENRPTSQIMEVQSISGNTITFSSPFHMTFDVAHTAQVTGWDTKPLTNSGLEDVYVSGVPAPGGNVQYNDVVLTMAKYSWAKNVETDNSNGYGMGIDQSFRCIVRDSYIHSTINPTPGGAGYGLEFSMGSADNLAENNISWNFNKVMVMRASGGGNVMAYNYMDDGWIAYQPNWVESGINAAHMTTPHFELFEGNLSFALGSDDTWGGSTFITWLRNVATNHRSAWPPLNSFLFNSATQSEGGCTSTGVFDDNCIPYTDAGNRAAAIVNYGDEFFNYVGNVLGSIGMPRAPESQGFTYANNSPDWLSDPVPMWTVGFGDANDLALDQGVANTTFRDGNFDYATNSVKWAGSPQTIPNSLYTCSKPSFFGGYAWPWSDGSNATTPYQTHSFKEYPLSTTLGTFGTSGTMVTYSGYQLPAFVRFLQLHGIEQPPADCATATLASMPTDCSLLFTGNVLPPSLQSQTITFANPGTQTVGVPLTLSATASSGLAVSFASQTSNTCTVSGTTATFLTAGTCTIQVTQSGNSTYAAATPVTQNFTVTAGAASADLSISPQAHDFGSVSQGTASAAFSFTVSNSGASSATSVSLALTAGTDFAMTANSCGTTGVPVTVAAGGNCTFSVIFSPSAGGARSDILTVTHDGGQIATVVVSGTSASSSGANTVGYASCPAPAGSGVMYSIGLLSSSGQATGPQTIAAFTHWNDLNPGDVVCIYGRSAPYAERLVLTRSGSDDQHRIRIVGVIQGGYEPILTGKSATTASAFNYGTGISEYYEGGEVSVTGLNYNSPVAYLNIEGLTIQGATTAEVGGTVVNPTFSNNTYSDPNLNGGAQSPWDCGAAGVNLIRSDHISIIHNRIKDNDNGIFVNSNNGNTSSNILVAYNHIYGNGVGTPDPGNSSCGFDSHGTYTEAENITYLGNRFGALRHGQAMNLLKDRSSGLIVAYNLFLPDGVLEASLGDQLLIGSTPGPVGHILDLVESYDSSVGPPGGLQSLGPAYDNVSVYGNIFFDDSTTTDGSQGTTVPIHFGGDQGASSIYRHHLHFYNNTVVTRRADGVGWLEIEPTANAEAWNNIFYAAYVGSSTPYPPAFNLLSTWCYDKQYGSACGTVSYLDQNWNSPIWGTVGVNGSASSPNFFNLANNDVHIATNDPTIVGNGQAGDAAFPANTTTVPVEYSDFLSTVSRPFAGSKIDLGALGYSSR